MTLYSEREIVQKYTVTDRNGMETIITQVTHWLAMYHLDLSSDCIQNRYLRLHVSLRKLSPKSKNAQKRQWKSAFWGTGVATAPGAGTTVGTDALGHGKNVPVGGSALQTFATASLKRPHHIDQSWVALQPHLNITALPWGSTKKVH